jgi:hypothetical protein
MHLQPWQARVCVVSPLPSYIEDRMRLMFILAGNILATIFPLFTTQMFDRMTYKWANTLVALIAVVMIPIPYVGV